MFTSNFFSRFAQFMSTGQHIIDDEVRTHEVVDPSHWLTEESEDETLNTSSHALVSNQ